MPPVTLQNGDFKDCVVPTWRISDKEPTDLKKGPAIPADAKWKLGWQLILFRRIRT